MRSRRVLTIQPAGLDSAEEELTAVGVGTGVGHGKDSCNRCVDFFGIIANLPIVLLM